jgi:KUP system potassium uptake protein
MATPDGAQATKISEEEGHPSVHSRKLWPLTLGALGVVYGDIGTSPLYALKECVHGEHAVAITSPNILGLLSLIFYSVMLVVSLKYLTYIMKADNQGEGGILALLALLPESAKKKTEGRLGILSALILFGAALLYGDGIITPAVSVLGAVEGLKIATQAFQPVIVPVAVVILVALFAMQRRGTDSIGRLFGPIMLLWFLTIGGLGAYHIAHNPSVIAALNPLWAVRFFLNNGAHGYAVLGAVVLCITGGEALYADMGHFGRKPIQIAWYAGVLPALILNYFGQGALLLRASPSEVEAIARNPFFALVGEGPWIYPLIILATCAAVIASQALISGAYSLTRQAVQLSILPRVTIMHTSRDAEGQIYIPEVNLALAIGCVALVLVFGDSSKLAAAYGIAVTGTMGITSLAYYAVARRRWGWSVWRAGIPIALFLAIDFAFLGANLLKFFHGGFVPVAVAGAIYFCMHTWKRGRALLARYFSQATRPLDEFLAHLCEGKFVDEAMPQPIVRVPGVAVFLTSNPNGTPPLLLHHVRHNKALHEYVMLVTVVTEHVPRVSQGRLELEALDCGFFRLRIRVGFMETINVARAVAVAARAFRLPLDPDKATYYLGRETILATTKGEMNVHQERVFAMMTRNAQQAPRYFGIPPERVVEIGMQVDL